MQVDSTGFGKQIDNALDVRVPRWAKVKLTISRNERGHDDDFVLVIDHGTMTHAEDSNRPS
ncbi:hypothetical protein BgiMline_004243, partial [Biomphalaria glabrata]